MRTCARVDNTLYFYFRGLRLLDHHAQWGRKTLLDHIYTKLVCDVNFEVPTFGDHLNVIAKIPFIVVSIEFSPLGSIDQ